MELYIYGRKCGKTTMLTDEILSELSDAMGRMAVSAEKAAEAFQNLSRNIPPFTEEDIQRVKANPSLTFLEKHQIIRSMRKQMKGET